MTRPQPEVPQGFGDRLAQERRLKAVRDRRDVEQKTVAEAMGVEPSTVSRWESGSIPRDDVLRRLADYFGVTASWLRYGEGERPAIPEALPKRFVSGPEAKDLRDQHSAQSAQPETPTTEKKRRHGSR